LAAFGIWGEAVACDDSGVPSFDLLRRRQRDDRASLYAFDLIELAADDRRRDPLEQRRVDLARLLADASLGLVLRKWIDGNKLDGKTVFEQVYSPGREGIVSKRKDSRYIAGRSPYWLKMKSPTSDAVRRGAEDELARQSTSSPESPKPPRSPTYTSRDEARAIYVAGRREQTRCSRARSALSARWHALSLLRTRRP
jgi:ATP-dependent DNA ligase